MSTDNTNINTVNNNDELNDSNDQQAVYLGNDETLEEHVDDDGGEPMEDDDDDDNHLDDEPELNENEQAAVEMINAKDDSIQGYFNHKEPIYSLSIHPNNPDIVVSGGGDDKAHVWSMIDGENAIAILEGHTDSVTSVKFSHDGQFLATGGMDGHIKIWSSNNWSLVTEFELGDECTWIDWHPRGTVLLAGSADPTIWMWKLPQGDNMNVFSGHTDIVTCGRFSPDGKSIISASTDGSLIGWLPTDPNPQTKVTANDTRFNLDGGIIAMGVNPAGTLAVAGGAAGGVRVVNLSNGQVIGSFEAHKEGESVECVSFLPEGSIGQGPAGVVVTGGTDGVLNVIDLTTMRIRNTINLEEPVTVLEFQQQSPLFTVGSVDQKLRTFDARTGKLVKEYEGHSDAILSIAVSKDGKRLLSGSDDGTVLVFDGNNTK